MTRSNSPIRWGIIGAGDVCEVKSGPALQRATGSALVAVMRRDGTKARDFARRHGVARAYDDADALIHDPEVDAVYIATPPSSHAEYTRRAAAARKPVYVEKPMARNHAECEAMVAACEQAGVPLFVAYYRRALPNILKVKALLAEGAIGDVRYVDITLNKPLYPDIVGASRDPANWRTTPEIAGGGYFYDLASHQLDVVDFLLGPIAAAQGFARNQGGVYGAEDIVTGVFHFAEAPVLGRGTWCFAASAASEREVITFIGSGGEIAFSCFGDHSVTLRRPGAEPEVFKFEIPRHIQLPLIQTIVDTLRGQGTCPSTGVSGARTARVMDELCRRLDAQPAASPRQLSPR